MTRTPPGVDRIDVGRANGETAEWKTSAGWWWATVAVLTVGAALRCWQYFANASIVLDEAAVARNVLDRRILALLTPLDYAQVAPAGFLLAVKVATVLFGPSEWVLRFVPFLFGLGSLLLFRRVAESLLERPAALAGTFMFATAIPVIFFSDQVKQYSGDVAMTLAIVWAALRLLDATNVTRRQLAAAAALGLGALIFSQSSVFSLTVAGTVLVADAVLRRRQDTWIRIALVSIWAVEVLGALANGYRSMTSVDRAYMYRNWTPLFMPHSLARAGPWLMGVTRATTFAQRGMAPSIESLHYPFVVFGVLFLVGSVTVVWARRMKGALVVGPILLELAAAAAGAFPLATRVGLFLIPSYLLAVTHGADTLSRMVLRRRVGAFGCLLLVPLATYALCQRLPPNLSEHVRPVMEYVAERRQADDPVWVYYGAGQAFLYYQQSIPITGNVQIGDCDRQDPRAYLHQVDVERGRRRVWFIFAHFSAAFGFDERGLLLKYLDTIGRRLDEYHAPPEDHSALVAAAYLYDLSDAERLSRADANTFQIVGKFTPAAWSCYGVASPISSRNGEAVKAVMKLAPR